MRVVGFVKEHEPTLGTLLPGVVLHGDNVRVATVAYGYDPSTNPIVRHVSFPPLQSVPKET